jgi:hypothetical protein
MQTATTDPTATPDAQPEQKKKLVMKNRKMKKAAPSNNNATRHLSAARLHTQQEQNRLLSDCSIVPNSQPQCHSRLHKRPPYGAHYTA